VTNTIYYNITHLPVSNDPSSTRVEFVKHVPELCAYLFKRVDTDEFVLYNVNTGRDALGLTQIDTADLKRKLYSQDSN
jgi:hypothetical protein